MARRIVRLLAALLLGLAPWSGALMAGDEVVWPSPVERYSSASGAYQLEIRLRPGAGPHAAGATASLFDSAASPARLLWSRDLAHRPRPRFALVGDQGQVLLLDEGLNLRSELAVMLVDGDNRLVATHDLEAVRRALDVPIAALSLRARHGVWIQAPPVLSADGKAAEVAVADRLLVIDLRDGRLSAR